jgi:hypothetical protein
MAGDIPREIGALDKMIREYRIEGTEDLHRLTELLRTYFMDASETADLAEYEIRSALQHYDRGSSKRARQVTRPLRQGQSLVILAARRAVATYKAYQKAFAEEIAHNRNRTGRRFDPEK